MGSWIPCVWWSNWDSREIQRRHNAGLQAAVCQLLGGAKGTKSLRCFRLPSQTVTITHT